MKKSILLFFSCLFYANAHYPQSIPAYIKDSLDAYIEKALYLWQIPGLSIAITQGDSIIYIKGFGVSKIGSSQKVDSKTIFPIGSMGKSFTAFSIGLLHEELKLSLNDRVKKWLPWFALKVKSYENDLRINDLLSHRTGMETFRGDLLWTESSLGNKAIIKKWGKFQPSFPIRSTFGYSNIGYMIAGEIIYSASGLTWQQFTRQNILDLLNMKYSLLEWSDVKRINNVAVGHTIVNQKLNQIPEGTGVMQAFGGMYSNVEDLAKWIMMHANDGRVKGTQLFPEGLIWNMRHPLAVVGKQYFPHGNLLTVNYGLGWDMVNYYNREIVSHGGAYSGFLSMMGYMPKEKVGFVILTNSDSHEFTEAVRQQIVDVFLGIETKNYSSEMYEYIKQRIAEQDKINEQLNDSVKLYNTEAISLKRFEGEYVNEIYGKITLQQRGKQLFLQMEHHPSINATLSWISNDRFLCVYNHPMFGTVVWPFTVINNVVKGLTFSVHPSLEYSTYYFRKK